MAGSFGLTGCVAVATGGMRPGLGHGPATTRCNAPTQDASIPRRDTVVFITGAAHPIHGGLSVHG
ncbi:MAG TPA: hypothetical protein VNZ61_25840 [Roseomonas sp.]|nr:hypothetical protein [Roseomonas sp.]